MTEVEIGRQAAGAGQFWFVAVGVIPLQSALGEVAEQFESFAWAAAKTGDRTNGPIQGPTVSDVEVRIERMQGFRSWRIPCDSGAGIFRRHEKLLEVRLQFRTHDARGVLLFKQQS